MMDHRTVTGAQLFKELAGGNKGPMYQAKWEDALFGAYSRGFRSAFFLGMFETHYSLINAGVRNAALMDISVSDKHSFDDWFRAQTARSTPSDIPITLVYTDSTVPDWLTLLLVRSDRPDVLTELLMLATPTREEMSDDYHRKMGQLLGYGEHEIEAFVARKTARGEAA